MGRIELSRQLKLFDQHLAEDFYKILGDRSRWFRARCQQRYQFDSRLGTEDFQHACDLISMVRLMK